MTVWERVKGTSQPHGTDATGEQKGAAYFFEPEINEDNDGRLDWTQVREEVIDQQGGKRASERVKE